MEMNWFSIQEDIAQQGDCLLSPASVKTHSSQSHSTSMLTRPIYFICLQQGRLTGSISFNKNIYQIEE